MAYVREYKRGMTNPYLDDGSDVLLEEPTNKNGDLRIVEWDTNKIYDSVISSVHHGSYLVDEGDYDLLKKEETYLIKLNKIKRAVTSLNELSLKSYYNLFEGNPNIYPTDSFSGISHLQDLIGNVRHRKSSHIYNSLSEEIENSKYILGLKDNWDDEDSIGYEEQTWMKAIRFIQEYFQWAKENFSIFISTPKIYHGPNGTIDILWKNENFRFMINIPRENKLATYYGDDYENGKIVIEDSFDVLDLKNQRTQMTSILLFLLRIT